MHSYLFNLTKTYSLKASRTVMNLKAIKMAPHMHTEDPDSAGFAIEILRAGGVIALPTDTVYGIACCATNITAVNKLYEIKARNENKPVAICVGKEGDVRKWAEVAHLPNGLLNSLLPGPVTLILKCAHKLDKSLNFNGKIGIRIPDYNFIRHVCNGLTVPIALTSANVSSEPSSVKVDEFKSLWDKLSGIFDGGVLGVGDSNRGASTVVDLCEPGFYKIKRVGIACGHTSNILNEYGLKNMLS